MPDDRHRVAPRHALMRSLLVALLALVPPAGGASAQTPPSAASLADARAIVAIIVPPARRVEVFGTPMRMIVAQSKAASLARLSDAGLRAIVAKRFDAMPAQLQPGLQRHIPMMTEALARAFVREFSPAELTRILAFAHTPAGAHFLVRGAALGGDPDVAAANKAYMGEAVRDFGAMEQDLATEMRAYVAKHPQAAPKPAQAPPAPSARAPRT